MLGLQLGLGPWLGLRNRLQSDLYYPRYLGVLNFGLTNRGLTRSTDNRGANNRALTVFHISWAY